MADTPQFFRGYIADELGPDGYPRLWHRGLGFWPALDRDDGTYSDNDLSWISGKEAEDAVADFVEKGGIKDVVRAQAGHRCVRCGHPYRCGVSRAAWSPCDEHCTHDNQACRWLNRMGDWTTVPLNIDEDAKQEAAWRVLTVHHLDGDKANCRWWNLAALCQRCHLTIQGKVKMDRRWPHEHSDWFKPYVAAYYALIYTGNEVSRSYVEEHLDELLALEVRALL